MKILGIFLAVLVASMVFASAVPYTNAKDAKASQVSLSNPTSSESSGIPRSRLSKYGWDGEKCILRPLVSNPVLVRKDRVESKGVIWANVGATNLVSDVFEYRIYQIKPIAAYNPETKWATWNKVCDSSKIDAEVHLPMYWWRYPDA